MAIPDPFSAKRSLGSYEWPSRRLTNGIARWPLAWWPLARQPWLRPAGRQSARPDPRRPLARQAWLRRHRPGDQLPLNRLAKLRVAHRASNAQHNVITATETVGPFPAPFALGPWLRGARRPG
jgi:hypothetical protein